MLSVGNEIYCGVFDSDILRKNQAKSQSRTVLCYELELFHNSSGVSYINGNKYPVRKGMLLCAKPGQVRHSDFPVRCSFIRIMLGNGQNKDVEQVISSLPEQMYIDDEKEIERLMELFSKLSANIINATGDQTERVRVNGIFLDILYRCIRLSRGRSESDPLPPVDRIAREAYEYINEHYTEDCSLRVIADAVNISPNYLHTVFTRNIGMTPFECVVKKRTEKAKKLIITGEKSMLDIALETGFCSQSHFNKVFKAQTGQTPIEYRKNMLDQY